MTVHVEGHERLPNHPGEREAGILVGVCAPVYNEVSSIAATVRHWSGLLRAFGMPSEIVLCDDGSTDGTFETLSAMDDVPEMRLVRHTSNRGAGAALRTAIAHSRSEWLIIIDSDGQFALEDGLRMLDETRDSGARACIGYRKKQDRALLVLGSRWTNRLASRIYGSRVRDFSCALKVVHGEECRAMPLRATRFDGSVEITSRVLLMGLPSIESPVTHRTREEGRSKIRAFRDGLARLLFIRFLRIEERLIRNGSIDLGQRVADLELRRGPSAREDGTG